MWQFINLTNSNVKMYQPTERLKSTFKQRTGIRIRYPMRISRSKLGCTCTWPRSYVVPFSIYTAIYTVVTIKITGTGIDNISLIYLTMRAFTVFFVTNIHLNVVTFNLDLLYVGDNLYGTFYINSCFWNPRQIRKFFTQRSIIVKQTNKIHFDIHIVISVFKWLEKILILYSSIHILLLNTNFFDFVYRKLPFFTQFVFVSKLNIF